MSTTVDREIKVTYHVYSYTNEGSFESLKEAREQFRGVKKLCGQGSISKHTVEVTTITTKQVIQGA